MQWVSHAQAREMLGHDLTANYGGLYFPSALTISPKLSTQNLGAGCTHIYEHVAEIQRQDDRWQVLDKNGDILAETDVLFVCNGANILDLWPVDVRFTRGQICWGDSDKAGRSLIAGNYATTYGNGMLLGATHDHVGAGEISVTNAADTTEILEQYGAATGQKIDGTHWQSRAAVRVTTRNTLPIAAMPKEGLYTLSGLGSRGLMMAPLLGEAMVCKALGEPSPLDIRTQDRFGSS